MISFLPSPSSINGLIFFYYQISCSFGIQEQLKYLSTFLLHRHACVGVYEFVGLAVNMNKWNQFFFKIQAPSYPLISYIEIFYNVSVLIPTYLPTCPFMTKLLSLAFLCHSLSLPTVPYCSLLYWLCREMWVIMSQS